VSNKSLVAIAGAVIAAVMICIYVVWVGGDRGPEFATIKTSKPENVTNQAPSARQSIHSDSSRSESRTVISAESRPVESAQSKSAGEDISIPPTPLEMESYEKRTHITQACIERLDNLSWAMNSNYWNPDQKKLTPEKMIELRELLKEQRSLMSKDAQQFSDGLTKKFKTAMDRNEIKPQPNTTVFRNQEIGYTRVVTERDGFVYELAVRPSLDPDLRYDWENNLRSQVNVHNRLLWFFRDL